MVKLYGRQMAKHILSFGPVLLVLGTATGCDDRLVKSNTDSTIGVSSGSDARGSPELPDDCAGDPLGREVEDCAMALETIEMGQCPSICGSFECGAVEGCYCGACPLGFGEICSIHSCGAVPPPTCSVGELSCKNLGSSVVAEYCALQKGGFPDWSPYYCDTCEDGECTSELCAGLGQVCVDDPDCCEQGAGVEVRCCTDPDCHEVGHCCVPSGGPCISEYASFPCCSGGCVGRRCEPPGGYMWPCESDLDCLSGSCIQSDEGGYCALRCELGQLCPKEVPCVVADGDSEGLCL